MRGSNVRSDNRGTRCDKTFAAIWLATCGYHRLMSASRIERGALLVPESGLAQTAPTWLDFTTSRPAIDTP